MSTQRLPHATTEKNARTVESKRRLSTVADGFGIPTDVFAAIEETVYNHLDGEALMLEFLPLWRNQEDEIPLVPADLTGKARQFVLSENVARETAFRLQPMLLEAAREYAEMLTRTIIQHHDGERAIHWKTVADRAVRFCVGLTVWEKSARWLYGPIKAAGLDWKNISPRSRPAYLVALSAWMLVGPHARPSLSNEPAIEGVQDLLRERIREIARLAPETSKGTPPFSLDADRTTATGAAEWRDLHHEFMRLADEEERLERATPSDRLLRGYCDYSDHPEVLHEKGKPQHGRFCLIRPPETGLWIVSDGMNENFHERFRALAARAGDALGSPRFADPEDFWLHRLYLDLCENKSKLLFCGRESRTNIITRLCIGSATFCSRLERKATAKSVTFARPEAKPRNQRESFVLPILVKKGWSVLDWALNADVDFHTASDYLSGRTKPYKSTRAKLAGSLNVEVSRLPS